MVDAIPSGAPLRSARPGPRQIRAADADRDAPSDRHGLSRDRGANPEESAPHAGAPGSGLLAALDSLNALLPDPDRLHFVLGGNGENPKIVLVERATGVALGTTRVDELETLGLRLARGSLLVDDHV